MFLTRQLELTFTDSHLHLVTSPSVVTVFNTISSPRHYTSFNTLFTDHNVQVLMNCVMLNPTSVSCTLEVFIK